jgi:conserved repeat domain
MLSVDGEDENKNKYIRLMIYLDDPLPLDEIEEFCTQVCPLSGIGDIEIRLFLDVNGDGKYSSKKSEGDNWLKTNKVEWWNESDEEWGVLWSTLDVFDPQFNYQDRSKTKFDNFTDCQEELGNAGVVRFWITIYEVEDSGAACLIDYLRLGGYVVSFEPLEDQKPKKGSPSKATPGRKITYTITYGNDLTEPLTNLVITERYDPRTTIISASPLPDPGTNNVWTIGTVQPGYYGQIKIVMRVAKQKCKAVIDGRVSGTGYVSVRQRLSTERSSHVITNKVEISCDQFNQSATERTAVKPVEERSITFSEHGSGTYASSEELRYTSTRLGIDRELDACRSPGMINLSHGRSLVYNTSWFASRTCEDQKKLVLLSERFLYGDKLESCVSAQLYGTKSKTRARIDSESNFSGLAIYEIGSRIDERNAALLDILYGNYSVVASNEINVKSSKKDDRWELYHSMKVKQTS